jgi:hypothetical protein
MARGLSRALARGLDAPPAVSAGANAALRCGGVKRNGVNDDDDDEGDEEICRDESAIKVESSSSELVESSAAVKTGTADLDGVAIVGSGAVDDDDEDNAADDGGDDDSGTDANDDSACGSLMLDRGTVMIDRRFRPPLPLLLALRSADLRARGGFASRTLIAFVRDSLFNNTGASSFEYVSRRLDVDTTDADGGSEEAAAVAVRRDSDESDTMPAR